MAPPFLPPYFLEVLISILLFAYLGSAWNVLGGYAGQFSFGHAAFFGIGAYTSTLLFLRFGHHAVARHARGRLPGRRCSDSPPGTCRSATACAGPTSRW